MIKMEETKKLTSSKTATQNFHFQKKRSEAFQKFQDSMKSQLSSPIKDSMVINHVTLSSKNTKDAFAHIIGKLGELPNQRRERVAR